MARWEDAFSWSRKEACGLYPWSRRRWNRMTFPTLLTHNMVPYVTFSVSNSS
jgi:hypothetical protein